MAESKHSFIRELSMEEYRKVNFDIYYIDDDIVIFNTERGDSKIYNLPRCQGTTRVDWEEAVLCLNGSSEGYLNGELQQLKKNTLTILPSNFVVSDVKTRNDVVWMVVCVSKNKFKQLVGADIEKWNRLTYQNRTKTIHLRTVDVEELQNCAKLIKNLDPKDIYYKKKASLILQWLLYSMLGHFSETS